MRTTSEIESSENRKEGLKYIAQAVYQLLKENKSCTYSFICKSVSFQNLETLRRRIYDVLNVMKAVKLINQQGKNYYLINNRDDINRKKNELNKLNEMKKVFKFIVNRNSINGNDYEEKLYLPFMVVSTSKDAEIHCETNEERTFFIFKSSRPLKVVEDLEILKEICDNSESKKGTAGFIKNKDLNDKDKNQKDYRDMLGINGIFYDF